MSLKDLAKLIDVKAIEKVHVYDPLKDRQKAIVQLDRTLETFTKDPKSKGKKYFVMVNDGVVLNLPFRTGHETKVTIGNRTIDGIPMAMESFPAAIQLIRESVESGALDAALKGDMVEGPRRSGGTRKPWTDEQKAAQAARIKATWDAKKAKKK